MIAPVEFLLVLREEVTPKTLELYHALHTQHGDAVQDEFQREAQQRLEESFTLQEQVTTLEARVEAYQEYVYELQERLKILDSLQTGVDQILQEVQALKLSGTSEQQEPSETPPKQHEKPSLAIRTLKRLQEKT